MQKQKEKELFTIRQAKELIFNEILIFNFDPHFVRFALRGTTI